MVRFLTLLLAASALLGAVAPTPAGAQEKYPSRPIRIIVPFPAGGVMDPLTRSIAQYLSESMGQQVLIENRPGATGVVGLNICAKSPPDGYTLCAISSDSLSVVPFLIPNLPYDPEKDFTAIAQLVYVRAILVANSRAPFNSFSELVAHARANPGKLNFSSFGEGSAGHQAIEIIKRATGTSITHVPYKGAGPAIQAVVAGEVELSLSTPPVVLPHIKSGRLKPLALPGDQRMPILPDVPTYKELGIDLELRSWFGLIGPANLPRDIVNRLNAEIVKTLNSSVYREKFLEPSYYEATSGTATQFAELMKVHRVWGRQIAELLKDAGYKAPQQ
ncbi:MAG: tripartite tricarboxylate transporter substrate binding protein [Betaproteobacteria bacterium]|nr:tripartite tricarboxylate transporter substrate binding protein [Betaproteobacteria bacterium]